MSKTTEILYFYKIKSIKKVIDANTITALIDCGFETFAIKTFKLRDVKIPEIHANNLSDEEREIAVTLKNKLQAYIKKINGHTIYVKSHKKEKDQYEAHIYHKINDPPELSSINNLVNLWEQELEVILSKNKEIAKKRNK